MAPTSKDNLTAVLHGVNDLRLEQTPIPVPNDDQVLLRMEAVGICGSDVSYWTKGFIGHFILKAPMIIGHEASGTVVGVGKNVKNLKPGDRVAIEPGVSCRRCSYCKEGKYNLCINMVFCATPPIHGNLARYYVHDADFCFKLPDHVSLEEGAILEPLSVGVHGCKRAGVGVGSVVLVLGAGPIGLVTLLAAKAFGASKVLITDIVQHRLDKAKELGADYTIFIEKGVSDEAIVKDIVDLLGDEPTVSMDCSGAEQSVRVAIQATKSGGTALIIGLGAPEMKIPLTTAMIREVDIKGVFRYCNDYPTSLDLIATGKINVKPLITHNYTLEQTLEAFETAKTGIGNPIKVMIHANPDWKPQ